MAVATTPAGSKHAPLAATACHHPLTPTQRCPSVLCGPHVVLQLHQNASAPAGQLFCARTMPSHTSAAPPPPPLRHLPQVYQYYAHPDAWVLAPGAAAALARMRSAGLRLAVVSNFDTRLRPILLRLGIAHMFDAIVVSAEVGVEKPNPLIYEEALLRLGCGPSDVVHVGDDRRNDVWGARDAGVNAWLWGVDVRSFQQVADRLLLGKGYDWADETDEDEAGEA